MHSRLEAYRADVGFAQIAEIINELENKVAPFSESESSRGHLVGEWARVVKVGLGWRLEAIPLVPEWRKELKDCWLWWDEAMRCEAL